MNKEAPEENLSKPPGLTLTQNETRNLSMPKLNQFKARCDVETFVVWYIPNSD